MRIIILVILLFLTLVYGVSAVYDEGCGCEIDEPAVAEEVTPAHEPYFTRIGYTIDPKIKAVYDPQTKCWFDTETGDAYDRPKGSKYTEQELEERWEELLLDPDILLVATPPPGKEAPFLTATGLTVNPAKRQVFDPITETWFDIKTGGVVITVQKNEYTREELAERWEEINNDREIIRFIPLIS